MIGANLPFLIIFIYKIYGFRDSHCYDSFSSTKLIIPSLFADLLSFLELSG